MDENPQIVRHFRGSEVAIPDLIEALARRRRRSSQWCPSRQNPGLKEDRRKRRQYLAMMAAHSLRSRPVIAITDEVSATSCGYMLSGSMHSGFAYGLGEYCPTRTAERHFGVERKSGCHGVRV